MPESPQVAASPIDHVAELQRAELRCELLRHALGSDTTLARSLGLHVDDIRQSVRAGRAHVAALVALAEHVVALEGDAHMSGHPEWNEIVDEAKRLVATSAEDG